MNEYVSWLAVNRGHSCNSTRARVCVCVRVIQLFLVPLIFALAIHSLQFQQIDNATAPVIRS